MRRVCVPVEANDSVEVCDVLNLLRLLDNPLQDVPLIAVLRSPFVGLSSEDLGEIRLAHREGNFWTALQRWNETSVAKKTSAAEPEEKNVEDKISARAKVTLFLDHFHAWRKALRAISLSRCIEKILDQTVYLDWLRAQSRGSQRAGNIERLLKMARQFDLFQREGLFRFLKFIEAQEEAEIESDPAPEGIENAVRLMSIHQSKGLEFPIVVVAGLGKRFNFSDTKERVILDQTFGLAPQIKPPNSGRRYPSLPHWLAQRRQKSETLGEEIRLLYVATTRACEQLILVGSASENRQNKWAKLAAAGLGEAEILHANSALDWIGSWLATQQMELGESGSTKLLSWKIHQEIAAANPVSSEALTDAAKKFPQIPASKLEALRRKLEWNYSFGVATVEPAKTSVSALRRRLKDESDEEIAPAKFFTKRRSDSGTVTLAANEVGSAHHRFLELVNLENVESEKSLREEATRIRRENYLSEVEIASLNFAAIARFWNSEIGRRILGERKSLRREMEFTVRFSREDLAKFGLAENLNLASEEFVIVQGVVDLAVILPHEIWLLDFKTDAVGGAEISDRAKFYESQLTIYAEAFARIFKRPLTNSWLHFLSCGETIAFS